MATLGCNDKYPAIMRFTRASCECCSRESPYCARVIFRQRKKRDGVVALACATCREAKAGDWVVARGWHDGITAAYEPKQVMTWDEWKQANPPYSDDEIAAIMGDGVATV